MAPLGAPASIRAGLALLLMFPASLVQGRELKFSLDVLALGGGSTLVDALYFTSASELYHSRFDYGSKFTIGAGVPYWKFLSLETTYTVGSNNLVVTNTSVFPHVPLTYPVRIYRGNLSAVVRAPFAWKGLRPYGAGGVEYDRFSPTPGAITTATNRGFGAVSTATINGNDEAGLNLGGGLERKLAKRLALRLDLRDHITNSPAFGLPRESLISAAFPVKGRANNIEYTAGIVVHLGK